MRARGRAARRQRAIHERICMAHVPRVRRSLLRTHVRVRNSRSCVRSCKPDHGSPRARMSRLQACVRAHKSTRSTFTARARAYRARKSARALVAVRTARAHANPRGTRKSAREQTCVRARLNPRPHKPTRAHVAVHAVQASLEFFQASLANMVHVYHRLQHQP